MHNLILWVAAYKLECGSGCLHFVQSERNLLRWLPLSCCWFIILPNPVPVTQARKRWNVAAKLACVMAAAESVSSVSFGSSHTAATTARGTGEAISEGRVVETRTFSPANTLVAPKLPLTGIIDKRANMAEQCFAVVGTL